MQFWLGVGIHMVSVPHSEEMEGEFVNYERLCP